MGERGMLRLIPTNHDQKVAACVVGSRERVGRPLVFDDKDPQIGQHAQQPAALGRSQIHDQRGQSWSCWDDGSVILVNHHASPLPLPPGWSPVKRMYGALSSRCPLVMLRYVALDSACSIAAVPDRAYAKYSYFFARYPRSLCHRPASAWLWLRLEVDGRATRASPSVNHRSTSWLHDGVMSKVGPLPP